MDQFPYSVLFQQIQKEKKPKKTKTKKTNKRKSAFRSQVSLHAIRLDREGGGAAFRSPAVTPLLMPSELIGYAWTARGL